MLFGFTLQHTQLQGSQGDCNQLVRLCWASTILYYTNTILFEIVSKLKSSLCQLADMGRGIAGGQARKSPGKLSPPNADVHGDPKRPLPLSVLLRGQTGLWLVIVSHVQMAAVSVRPLLLSTTPSMRWRLCIAVDKTLVCQTCSEILSGTMCKHHLSLQYQP